MLKFITSIKRKYSERRINRQKQWPPRHGEKLVRLELVHGKREGYSNQKGLDRDKVVRRTPIEYRDIFKVESGRKQQIRRILAEGDAGIGKTTLCIAISEGWATGELFQEFELVLHLPLREEKVASANTLPKLLELLHPKKEVRDAVTEHLVEEEGDTVLVLADGWDELSESKRHPDTFLHNFLLGDQYPFLSVLLTSRPSASGALHRHPNVDRFVEVCGFSPENIKEHILSEFDSNQEKAIRLVQQIDKNFLLQSVCVIPLNCAIVCHLWHSLEEALPTTMTGLYTKLILHTLLRGIQKDLVNDYGPVTSLNTFDDLPVKLQEPWQLLCKFAFQSLEKDQIIFSRNEFDLVFPNEIHSAIHSFGLLQFADSILAEGVGTGLSLHFLHLTFQEYLAALHMSKLSPQVQFALCKTHRASYRFSMVWRFLFGISELSESLLYHIMDEISINGSLLCHCAFEANSDEVKRMLVHSLKDTHFSFVYPTTTFDCVAVIHTVSKINSYKENDFLNLHFRQCGLGEKEITLLGEALATVPENVKVDTLDLRDNHLTDSSICSLFGRAPSALESLKNLNLNNNCIKDDAIGAFIKHAKNLHKLFLCNNQLELMALKTLEDASKFPNLRILRLRGSLPSDAGVNSTFLASLLQSLVQYCAGLQSLDLSDNDLGISGAIVLGDYLPLLGRKSVNFHLSINSVNLGDEGLKAFFHKWDSQHNCFLKQFHLDSNDIHATGLVTLLGVIQSENLIVKSLSLAGNPLRLEGTIILIKMLSVISQRLTLLDLSRCELAVDVGSFSDAADITLNIEKLLLDGNNFSGDNINILTLFIRVCPDLACLNSSKCSITSEDFGILLDQLKLDSFPSLESWYLIDNRIDSNGILRGIDCLIESFPGIQNIDIDGNPVELEVKRRLQTTFSEHRDKEDVIL